MTPKKPPRDPRGRQPLPLSPAVAARLHRQRQTVPQIAATLHCSTRTVNRLLATHRQSVRTPRGVHLSPSAIATIRAALSLFELPGTGNLSAKQLAIVFPDEFATHPPLNETDRTALRDLLENLAK